MAEEQRFLGRGAEPRLLEAYEAYLQYERGFSPSTVEGYLRDTRAFFAEVYPGIPLLRAVREVTVRAVRAWLVSQVSQELSPRTVNRHLASLSHFFYFLQLRDWVSHNPVLGVPRLHLGRRLPSALRLEEAAELFDGVEYPEGYPGQRDRTLLLALYSLGLRRAELVALCWEDVRFGERQVKVLGKGRKERLVPMTRELAVELERCRQLAREAFGSEGSAVFLTNSGQPLTAGFVYRLARRYLVQVSTLQRRGPHVLRHSYATHLLRGGADIVSIKELLGHVSLVSTQVYAEVEVGQLVSAYRAAHPRAGASGGGVGERYQPAGGGGTGGEGEGNH